MSGQKSVKAVRAEGDHRPLYIVSEDIDLLLEPWSKEKGLTLPDGIIFNALRQQMREKLEAIFPEACVLMVSSSEIVDPLHALLNSSPLPVISLDRSYTKQGLHLDCTRLTGRDLKQLGLGSRTQVGVDEQIRNLVPHLGDAKHVQLVDDVIFSGEGMVDIVERLNQQGIVVDRIVVGISINNGKNHILASCRTANPSITVESVVHFDNVIDEVCERDFYPGVPLSGRLLGEQITSGVRAVIPETGIPYLLPYSNPKEWATIPAEKSRDWSQFCLRQTRFLWYTIEKLSCATVMCEDLSRRPIFSERGVSITDHLDAMLKLI